MTQPHKRGAKVSAPGKVDKDLGDFWVENPWDIVSEGHNLSNHERQRLYMNQGGKAFFDLSFLSGADSDGDGVGDACDDCSNTFSGVAVNVHGCPLPIPGDFDGDGDVDMTDFGKFQSCMSGANIPQTDNRAKWVTKAAHCWAEVTLRASFLQ